jgi:hypothetical protein
LIIGVLLCGCQKQSAASSDQKSANVSINWATAEPFLQASSIGDAETFNAVFLGPDHVAIAVSFASLPDANAGRDFRDSVKRTVVVAVINANDGHLEVSKVWNGIIGQPAFGEALEIQPTASGNLILGFGDTVHLLSSSLVEKAKHQLPLEKFERNGYPYQNTWGLRSSGRTALLIKSTPDYNVENHWIDPESLKEQSVSSAPRYSLVQLLDDFVVFNENNGMDSDLVQIQPIGSSPHPLCRTCVGAVLSTFGQGYVFLSTRPDASYIITDSAGRQLYANTHRGESPIQNVAGARSNRIAFSYGRIKDRVRITNFAVLDLGLKREVWNFQLSEQPKDLSGISPHLKVLQYKTPKLAISPSGEKVAILTGDTLSVFAAN